MKLSVFYPNIIDAMNDSGLTAEAVLEKAKAAGITALDFDFRNLADGIPDAVKKSGMKINSIYYFLNYYEDEAFEKAKTLIDFAAEYGAVVMFVTKTVDREVIGELKEKTEENDIFTWLDNSSVSVKTAETVEKLSVYANGKGIQTAVENFDSHCSLTERKAEIKWLLKNAPHLGFNLDTGNSITCGEDILDLYNDFAERIVNVHCKDRTADNKTTVVGAGRMPVAEIKSRLLRAGYEGGFSVEVFGVCNPLEAIIKSAEYLR